MGTAQVKRIEIAVKQHLRNLSWVDAVGGIYTVEATAVLRNNHRRTFMLAGTSSLPFEAYRQWVANDALEDMSHEEHVVNARIYSELLTEMLETQELWL